MTSDQFWEWAQRLAMLTGLLGVGLVAGVKRIRDWLLRGVRKLLRVSPSVPRNCLRIVPGTAREYWWHEGTSGGKPAMQIGGRWHMTNVSAAAIQLLRVRLKVAPSSILTVNVEQRAQPLLPGRTTDVSVHAFIEPVPCRTGEDFTTDVILTDQFGNDYRLKKVVFLCDEWTKAKARRGTR